LRNADDVRRALERHTRVDVTNTIRMFKESTGSDDAALLVRFMVDKGMLSADAASQVEAEIRGGDAPTVVEPRSDSFSPWSFSPWSQSPGPGPTPSQTIGSPRTELKPLRLHEEIGRGGMGTVFRAEQLDLGRSVAFKQLLDGQNATLRERFMREARITAQLDHPNIVPVHGLEVSPDGRSIGYAMKLVEGKTLRDLLRETIELYDEKRPIDQAHSLNTRLEHFLRICDALAFAHDRGVLHRDLKPANFMLGKFNEVYVMDWGVARPIGSEDIRDETQPARRAAEPDLTQVGEIVGSMAYMSPEQADGRNNELDARADQYAIGLILYEIVSLRRAIGGATTEEAWHEAATGQKAPLRHYARERIHPELAAIIEKATSFKRDDRYHSVADLAADVRRHLRGEAVIAMPDNAVQRLLRAMSRHRRATLVAVLGVLALAAVTVSWALYRKAASELASRAQGERETALSIDVAAQARRIDSEFQKMEEGLEGLRVAAEWALTGPEPTTSEPLYFDRDFADPQKRPPDFTDKTSYRWPVSVDYPVIGLSPTTSRDAELPAIRRLASLRPHMRAMFVAAAQNDRASLSDAEQRELLLNRRGPIDYAHVSLPSGVLFMLPGMDSLPPGYDVRTAGFYKIADHQRGKRWGRPYVDSTTDDKGDDLVLPCTQGLWSKDGKFLGVAGVEITVTKLVETGLVLPGRTTLRTSLVDGDGKKVIDSNDAGKRFQGSGRDEGLELSDFDIPVVVTAVREGSSGARRFRRDDKDVLVLFVRLDVLGWYYVVEVDAATIKD
jgi:eukaryotic-like serine/threonine-protein kinase